MLREYLSNIADKFRTYLDTTEPINAQDFAGKVEDVAVRYNQLGFTNGREVGYNQGLEVGYNSAVREGTITVIGTPKELRIEGLPKAPKTFCLIGCNQSLPPSGGSAVYWVRGLEYLADGFIMQESGTKITAMTWLSLAQNIANTGGGNASIPEVNKDKVFKFENGTFIIDWSIYSIMYFGENFTYKWIAIF